MRLRNSIPYRKLVILLPIKHKVPTTFTTQVSRKKSLSINFSIRKKSHFETVDSRFHRAHLLGTVNTSFFQL